MIILIILIMIMITWGRDPRQGCEVVRKPGCIGSWGASQEKGSIRGYVPRERFLVRL